MPCVLWSTSPRGPGLGRCVKQTILLLGIHQVLLRVLDQRPEQPRDLLVPDARPHRVALGLRNAEEDLLRAARVLEPPERGEEGGLVARGFQEEDGEELLGVERRGGRLLRGGHEEELEEELDEPSFVSPPPPSSPSSLSPPDSEPDSSEKRVWAWRSWG